MSLTTLSANAVMHRLADFDALIDARSPAEFALDHLPGAVNWPTLNDTERRDIGTIYQQVNPFEARKRGAAIAARNLAKHIENHVIDQQKSWRPLLYCWRGGQRSGALALVLSEIGFRVTLIAGGYKAFRAAIVQDIVQLVPTFSLQIICGPTGSGKTRLLQALSAQGAQVLDLEALANHRSSVLGAIQGVAQPTQKRFDTLIWQQLSNFDPKMAVFVESESKKVGDLSVPAALIAAMREAPCLSLQVPQHQRIALLLEDYHFLTQDVDYFCDRLAVLTALRGRALVDRWQTMARCGQFASVVAELLTEHYDPAYAQSMKNNFKNHRLAKIIATNDHSEGAMAQLAQVLIKQ